MWKRLFTLEFVTASAVAAALALTKWIAPDLWPLEPGTFVRVSGLASAWFLLLTMGRWVTTGQSMRMPAEQRPYHALGLALGWGLVAAVCVGLGYWLDSPQSFALAAVCGMFTFGLLMAWVQLLPESGGHRWVRAAKRFREYLANDPYETDAERPA